MRFKRAIGPFKWAERNTTDPFHVTRVDTHTHSQHWHTARAWSFEPRRTGTKRAVLGLSVARRRVMITYDGEHVRPRAHLRTTPSRSPSARRPRRPCYPPASRTTRPPRTGCSCAVCPPTAALRPPAHIMCTAVGSEAQAKRATRSGSRPYKKQARSSAGRCENFVLMSPKCGELDRRTRPPVRTLW